MNYMEMRLIQLSRTGDRAAFMDLMELYKDKIQRLAYRMLHNKHDSEDIVQETFMRVYMHLNRYDETQKFSTWIFRIGKNLCIDLLRKKKVVYSLDTEILEGDERNRYAIHHSDEATPENHILRAEIQEQVRHVMNILPDKFKIVVGLYYFNELSLQEISEKLGIPSTTVKTRLHRGREHMRKKWGFTAF
ncbi:RNA polymerase sigma factor SigW [Paenibacillus chondroitinus]|uniref:RNA polymerase sigma factor n=1 Tax=Paenibacillus chondroitinus TaxID=59842 RepID=A0ABU6DIU2_9BACL|nr:MULTISPECIES: RNA polymerase sigma factor SigW [Paenibacillus]MCY9659513.1 RNA polymerase sigma factor SigW [Paenibacillus anseongense]MEB4796908.1 RNA polymerase sigma factor SigW [Paenibacillus chondroitinus]